MKRFFKASLLISALAFSSTAVSKNHSVIIEGMQFNPNALTIASGDTVDWVNKDIVPHTATSTSKEFNSAVIQSGGTWRHAFKKPTSIDYACSLHPTMKAKLTVK